MIAVCSTTLWVGHLSKLVYQEELSDTFGEFGDIVSIDQIVPRGCAFIVMNRRQDAHKAMQSLKNHKLQGRAITISWAAGKGVKSKEWKDYWDLELGVTFIPWNKLDDTTDFDTLEEGGMFDEDSMPNWMKEKINHIKSLKDKGNDPNAMTNVAGGNVLFGIDTTQPPPAPPGPPGGPPPIMPMVPAQFPMAPPIGGPPRPLLGPMGMPLSGIPMPPNMVPGMPPPHAMMMPTGMMPPGFPPMPGQVAGAGPHMNLPPPVANQFPPPPSGGLPAPGALAPPVGPNAANTSSDDQMDIEMDDDDNLSTSTIASSATNAVPPPQINFNQPPPMFPTNMNAAAGSANDVNGSEMFSRDRNRSSSRWGGSRADGNVDADAHSDGTNRWRENGNAIGAPGNFNDNRNGARLGANPLNIPPLDLNTPPQRPDFMNDFENRAGPRGGLGAGARGGDFFQNMQQQQIPQNRFNQPTSLLQMRIPPPPNVFNARMGGAAGGPMFMRPPVGAGGNRPQGPGFFNPRNPFNNDGGRGGNARPGGGRGGGRGGRNNNAHSGPGNWSDEEGDDVGNNFKRRGSGGGGGGGPSGNRFRDRDATDERNNRERGARRGSGTGVDWGANRAERRGDERSQRAADEFSGNRNNVRDEKPPPESTLPIEEKKPAAELEDIEEDWDRELEEYDARMATENTQNVEKPAENASEETTNGVQTDVAEHKSNAEQITLTTMTSTSNTNNTISESTPLYDETVPINVAPVIQEQQEAQQKHEEAEETPALEETTRTNVDDITPAETSITTDAMEPAAPTEISADTSPKVLEETVVQQD